MSRPFESCDSPSAKRRTCMLMVTHACNLHCTYCYEKFKSARYMSVEKAKELILKEIDFVKNSKEFDELEIDFMGGEPLLAFPLIKEVVEWLQSDVKREIPFICFATTNATLVNNDEIKNWLREHRCAFCLGVSYDGPPQIQSTNRGEKATEIDMDFFKELWPFQGAKMTISRESLPTLCESIVYAIEHGYRLEVSLAYGVEWTREDAKLYKEQLLLLKDYLLLHPEAEPCNLLTRGLIGVGNKDELQKKFCGGGVHMATYDVDGTLYPCHMFTPVVLGERALPTAAVEDWEDEAQVTDDSCRGCMFWHWCPTCMGFNYNYRNTLAQRDHTMCHMRAAEAMAACQYQLEYFTRHICENELTENEAVILQCAMQAYEHLRYIDMDAPFPQAKPE